jgi:hypothetical protein
MKLQKTSRLRKYLFPGLIIIWLIFLSTACDQKISFLNSSVVPAAKGTVKVKQDKNKNYAIEVDIVDLAEIERLQSSKQTYIVWIETERGNSENIGQLKSSTGFLSKQHKATLKTVSSFKPVKLFVTAEDANDIRYPNSKVILTTDSF